MKIKVLLLNLPGKEKYLREYFCSKISKARYYYPAVNLVYLTGRFSKDQFDISVIDSIAEKIGVDETINKIKDINPDFVYCLASAPSFKEDRQFIKELKRQLKTIKIIGDGDVFRELKEESFIALPELDAINLNFGSGNIVNYILGQYRGEEVENIIYKYGNKIIVGKENFKIKSRDVPIPRRELFNHNKYNHPFAIKEKSTVMLTDFGCAFRCSFCPLSNVDRSLRPLNDVVEEIKLLKSQGINDIFFLDQTFGVNKERTIELCNEIKKIGLSWCAFSRVDVVDEKLIKTMSESGCYEILFGIESANEEILKKYNKNTKQNSMFNAINLCKKYHIRSCGTFIIGLPGDSKESIKYTIKFARKLGLDYASFNIATPRIGTDFRNDMINQGWADPKDLNLESTKQTHNSWKSNTLSHKEIKDLQAYAIRSFYLNPMYLIKRLFGIKTIYELKNQILEGFNLIFRRN